MMVPRFLTNAYDIGHAVMWITAMMVVSFFLNKEAVQLRRYVNKSTYLTFQLITTLMNIKFMKISKSSDG